MFVMLLLYAFCCMSEMSMMRPYCLFFLGLLVPSITWKIQSLMVSVEARGVVVDQVKVFEKRISSLLSSKRIRYTNAQNYKAILSV